MKPQVCIIHGGDTFSSDEAFYDYLADKELQYERLFYAPSWKSWIAEQLPDHDVLLPSMPNKQNANYDHWALLFAKVVPFLRPDAVLVGHSLGGIFLAKYLSENPPAVPYAKLILLAAPYDDETNESLGGFKLSDASRLALVAGKIHLLHSTDDPVVPITELDKYAADLPNAHVHRLEDKHHFIDPTLPELLELLR